MAKTLIAAILIALSPILSCVAQVPAQSAKTAGVPMDAVDVPAFAVVISSVENMFRGPSAETDVVSQALLGDNVKVLKSEKNPAGEDWLRIATPDTYEGWVPASSLRILGPGAKPYASADKVFVVSSLLANTYREPDVTEHRPVKVAPIGTVLEVVGEKGGRWLEVNLPCNTRAWIQRGEGDVRDAPWAWPRRPVEDMIALSKRFIGLTYTWGGTSPLGFDCSGFVQLVYRMSGLPILRDAELQMHKSGLVEVPKGEERAGDLFFFGRALDRISHVGMMVDRENFINATTSRTPTVHIDRLAADNWQKIYQGARRPK